MGQARKEELAWEVEVPFLPLRCSSMGARTIGERWSGQSNRGWEGVSSEGQRVPDGWRKCGLETQRFEDSRDEVSNKYWLGLSRTEPPKNPSLDCTGAKLSSQWSLGLFFTNFKLRFCIGVYRGLTPSW